jgi:hypothetical protein
VTHRRPRRRRVKPPAPTPEPIRRFGYLMVMAYYEGALSDCPRKECKERRQCCGGPRGTMRRSGVPFCRSEAVVTRAALLDPPGDPRQRKHGQAWAEEKFAEFSNARPPQTAVSEEPPPPEPIRRPTPSPEPIRPPPAHADAIKSNDPPPADRHWDSEPSKHRYPRKRESWPETASETGSEIGSVRETASTLLKLLRQPLHAIDRQEVKKQLAALREQGEASRARAAARAEQRRRELEQ